MQGTDQYFQAGYYSGNFVRVIQAEDGYVKIGIRKTAAVANDWCIFSNFKAKYISEMNDELLLELARDNYNNQLNLADEFRETLAEADYSSLLYYYENEFAAIDDASSGFTSGEQYDEATQQLDELVKEYKVYLDDARFEITGKGYP